ncbi:hypothetical protein CDL12_03988 [Handroanthus impetiginosus]|uniref:Ribosomal protein L34 n=1 Tax=Handroanthus impetiginosus TaxID=429701 RepID=A0A2G9I0K4_9LAMI|nr:hypothetical protein CDL12_03988 [Handroanthus impetiginosus]
MYQKFLKAFKPPSLSLRTGSTTSSVSLIVKPKAPFSSGMLLNCAFTPSSISFSSGSSILDFSVSCTILHCVRHWSSLGLDLNSSTGRRADKTRGLVGRAAKYTICQTKRNGSRKSLARTHGFHKRMSMTRGRAVIKHRRAKGRWTLCTKTNPIGRKCP